MAGLDLGEQLVGDGDERVGPLDRPALHAQVVVVSLGKPVLVGRCAQAPHVVDVVDDRNSPVGDLSCEHREVVGQVVAVDHVGSKPLDSPPQVGPQVPVQVEPALEELVTLAVELTERLPLAGERKPHPRSGGMQPDGVLQRADARLPLQKEDLHRRLFIGLAGFPTLTVQGSRSLGTTLPAPTMQPSPMVTPGRMIAPMPIQQSSPIVTRPPSSHPCSTSGRSASIS